MPGVIARGCIDVIAGIAGLAGMVPALEPDAILQAADVPAEDDPRSLEPLAAIISVCNRKYASLELFWECLRTLSDFLRIF